MQSFEHFSDSLWAWIIPVPDRNREKYKSLYSTRYEKWVWLFFVFFPLGIYIGKFRLENNIVSYRARSRKVRKIT